MLIPNVSEVEESLAEFAAIMEADEVLLFEKSTFLIIAHAQRTDHRDIHRFEKISNIIKQFKLSCIKLAAQFTVRLLHSLAERGGQKWLILIIRRPYSIFGNLLLVSFCLSFRCNFEENYLGKLKGSKIASKEIKRVKIKISFLVKLKGCKNPIVKLKWVKIGILFFTRVSC